MLTQDDRINALKITIDPVARRAIYPTHAPGSHVRVEVRTTGGQPDPDGYEGEWRVEECSPRTGDHRLSVGRGSRGVWVHVSRLTLLDGAP